MKKRKKLNLSPIMIFILGTIFIIILSSLLSLLKLGSSFKVLDYYSNEVKNITVFVKNLLARDAAINIFVNSFKNLLSFKYFYYLIVTALSFSVLKVSGLLDAFYNRLKIKHPVFVTTFIAMALGMSGDFALVFLLPFVSYYFIKNKKEPLLAVVTVYSSFCFAYGVNIFSGFLDYNLAYSTVKFLEGGKHIPFLGTLFISLLSTIALSIIATYITNNIVEKKLPLRSFKEDKLLDLLTEEDKIKYNIKEKKSYKWALITFILMFVFYIYALVPGLPKSGILLDMNQPYFFNKFFNSQVKIMDGFMFTLVFASFISSFVYMINLGTFKSNNQFTKKLGSELKNLPYAIIVIYFYLMFLTAYKESNIGLYISTLLTGWIDSANFVGVPLLMTIFFLVGISGFFLPSIYSKWEIFSSTLISKASVAGVSGAFIIYVYKAADALLKGVSIFFGGYIIYLIFLNIYSDERIGIKQSISYLTPYILSLTLVYAIIIIAFYILGLPIGPRVTPLV